MENKPKYLDKNLSFKERAAELIFGDYSPAGRLPVTFYKSTEELPAFADYSMNNRTYKFMRGDTLYPFGFGLSYTSFEYSNIICSKNAVKNGESVSISVDVENTGSCDSDEVVELYIKDMEASARVPHHSLCGFKRIHLKSGQKTAVNFEIYPVSMAIVDEEGKRHIESGQFTVYAGGSQPDKVSARLTGKALLQAVFSVL